MGRPVMSATGTARSARLFGSGGKREAAVKTEETTGATGAFSGRKIGMLLCSSGAPFLIMLDTNIVAVSLPSIARDLHGGFTDVEWVVSAYILPFAALLMPAGALADPPRRERKAILRPAIFPL